MRRTVCIIFSLLLILLSVGCRPDVGVVREDDGTNVYILRKDEDGRKSFGTEKRVLRGLELNIKMDNILEALKQPRSRGAYASVPNNILVENVEMNGDILYIEFSPSYAYLDAEAKLIASVAVCMTVFDAGIAKYVQISCNDIPQPPLYSKSIFKSVINLDDRMYLE